MTAPTVVNVCHLTVNIQTYRHDDFVSFCITHFVLQLGIVLGQTSWIFHPR